MARTGHSARTTTVRHWSYIRGGMNAEPAERSERRPARCAPRLSCPRSVVAVGRLLGGVVVDDVGRVGGALRQDLLLLRRELWLVPCLIAHGSIPTPGA